MICPHYTSPYTPWMLVLIPVTFKWPLIKQESKDLIMKNKTLGGFVLFAVPKIEEEGERDLVICYDNYEEIIPLN